MRQPQVFRGFGRYFVACAAIALMFLLSADCAAQAVLTAPQAQQSPMAELNKYPGLLPEFERLLEKMQRTVQFPEPRAQSRVLPLLPQSTVFYVALPNYGDTAHQALEIFRQELQESPVLRQWWQKGVGPTGTKIEDSLQKFYEVSQYLGDEIVISAVPGAQPKPLIVAEIRKPGLKPILEQLMKELAAPSSAPVRVFTRQELATAQGGAQAQQLAFLVRNDFVVGAFDVATLRSFNARLNSRVQDFVSTPFGQRITQSYENGVTVLGAADLHSILQSAGNEQNRQVLESTGFGDVQYLVLDHRTVAGQAISQGELSFIGPRHGIAAWLTSPAPMGSLDFVSPRAAVVASALLASPARMFEDIKQLAGAAHPNAFMALEQSEQELHISIQEDLLRHLGGEVTFELDDANAPAPAWKAILRVSNPDRLQETLMRLAAATHFNVEQSTSGGLTYYTLHIPSPQKMVDIRYAFVGGYLVIASSQDGLMQAVQLHRSGESLGRSSKFRASLPPGHPSGCSAMFYQDPMAMTALQLRALAPEMAAPLAKMAGGTTPTVLCAYGEETAIAEASTSPTADVGTVAIVAAIAIPNLLRSRIAANEASAVGSTRSIVTAQVMYETTYPARGFAPDLASLGPDPHSPTNATPQHAGMLDATLAGATCTAGNWCTKSGFRFMVTAVCRLKKCSDFAATATPVGNDTGARSFCATSEGVVRFQPGPPLNSPVTAAQCQRWMPLQ